MGKHLRQIALWVMALSTVPALGGAAWALWQYHLIDYPVIFLTKPPIVIDQTAPGSTFAVTWYYAKPMHCNGRKVVSLYDPDRETYVRISQIDAHWQIGQHTVTEFYTVPVFASSGEYILVLDADFWCNFIWHVHQRIETTTITVSDGKTAGIIPIP
jgi:hypothetical protein